MIQCCPYHGAIRNLALCPDCLRLRNVPAALPARTSIPRSPEDQGRLRIKLFSSEDGRLDKLMFVRTDKDQPCNDF